MRRILAISVAAAVPATLPAVAAGAQSRPAPPSVRAHERLLHRLWTEHDHRGARHPFIGAPAAAGAAVRAHRHAAGDRPAAARPRIRFLPLGAPALATPSAMPASSAPDAHTSMAGVPAATAGAPDATAALAPEHGRPGHAQPEHAQPQHAQGRAYAPGQARRQAPTRLVLKTSMGSATPRTVTLLCDPPGGTHPKAAQACADLARSHGDFRIQSSGRRPRACFMIYSPVTVSAEGRWRGEDVQFSARFPNTCVMHGQTGAIFDF